MCKTVRCRPSPTIALSLVFILFTSFLMAGIQDAVSISFASIVKVLICWLQMFLRLMFFPSFRTESIFTVLFIHIFIHGRKFFFKAKTFHSSFVNLVKKPNFLTYPRDAIFFILLMFLERGELISIEILISFQKNDPFLVIWTR